MSGTDTYERAVRVTKAWGSRRPNKSFFGMSLEAFLKIIAPSAEAREELADLEARTRKALARRDEADKIT